MVAVTCSSRTPATAFRAPITSCRAGTAECGRGWADGPWLLRPPFSAERMTTTQQPDL